MQYRKFGKTGVDVSILGFGAMRLPTMEKNPKQIDEEQAEEMIRYALQKGINYIDTAYPYHGGESEKFLGKILCGKDREKIQLATKLPTWLIKEESDLDKYFNEQLERLQTDHFDFYLLHALSSNLWRKMKDLKVLDWCEKLKADGKIKFLGFSFHDTYPVFKKIIDFFPNWDFCQIQYNYMDTNFQAGRRGLKYSTKKGIPIIAMEPLRGGQLSKIPPPEIEKVWAKFPIKRSFTKAALLWLWNQSNVPLILSGMSNLQQVKENIEITGKAKVGIFSEKELEIFKKVRREYLKRNPIKCTSCKYCEPCPSGVAISDILEIYTMREMYDDPERATMFYKFFVKDENRADKCNDCGECESKCPQKIEINKWLKVAHKEFSEKEN
ncbi:MAG: aldo/keto reductase [Candidatus Cloacimonetes bacterium]|nr:aldo/keto reductase [Candidatus Cloacimonadota bacterium]